MGLHCVSWIPYLWVQLVDLFTVHPKKVIDPLPDDIIIEVLVRLPAEHILQCRRVCRRWRALTSTPYFIELHLKRASPSLLLQSNYRVGNGGESDLFIFEEAAKEEAKYSKIARNLLTMMQHRPYLICSCNGLVLFRKNGQTNMFFVVNPITREELALTPPEQPGFLSGIFFNRLTMDYELLCWHYRGNYCQYFIYALGAKMWREITSYSYWPSSASPAIVNGHVHWMGRHDSLDEQYIPPCANAILVYSIDSEDFCALPHPGHECPSRQRHGGMDLLVMKEQLSLCYMCRDSLALEIWVLQDNRIWSWIKRHRLNIYAIISLCPSFIGSYGVGSQSWITLLGIHNDELLFDWWGRGLFRYHLKFRNVREITRRGMGLSMVGGQSCWTTGYTKSLVKLK